MPAVQPPATVLVTGASGFSGIWIARALLEAGYSVRGTVRSEDKGQYVTNVLKAHGSHFTYTVVKDAAKSGAFDSSIDESISAVMHIAGSVHFDNADTSEIITTNIDSVVTLLESVKARGKNVKRFVYMSSAQAMLGNDDLFHVYTEDDWNEKAVAAYKEKGNAIDAQTAYQASKLLAERAVVDFVAKNKGEIGWDEVSFVPAWIFGPIIHDVKSIDRLNLSTKLMYQYMTSPRADDKVTDYASDYIDVRDVADAFVASLRVEAAGGERFVLDTGAFTYQNLYDAINERAPDLKGVTRGNTNAPDFSFPGPFCNPAKAQRVLQLKPFRSLGECAVDTYNSIREKGL